MTRDEFLALLETMAEVWNGNDPDLVAGALRRMWPGLTGIELHHAVRLL